MKTVFILWMITSGSYIGGMPFEIGRYLNHVECQQSLNNVVARTGVDKKKLICIETLEKKE